MTIEPRGDERREGDALEDFESDDSDGGGGGCHAWEGDREGDAKRRHDDGG